MNNTTEIKSELSAETMKRIRRAQVNEVTEYHIYKHLSRVVESPKNKAVLNKIADEELEHYRFWMQFNDEVEPLWWKVSFFIWIARMSGLVFSLKLMERSEVMAQKKYRELVGILPGISKIIEQETIHEKKLLDLLSDWRLKAFGTWLIATNLVLFVSVGVISWVVVFRVTSLHAGIQILFTALLVSLADFFNTYLMKTPGKLRREPFEKALIRFLSGCIIGLFISLPFLISANPVYAVSIAVFVLLLMSVLLNFYYAIISDHPAVLKIGRVLLSYTIIAGFVVATSFLIKYFTGI